MLAEAALRALVPGANSPANIYLLMKCLHGPSPLSDSGLFTTRLQHGPPHSKCRQPRKALIWKIGLSSKRAKLQTAQRRLPPCSWFWAWCFQPLPGLCGEASIVCVFSIESVVSFHFLIPSRQQRVHRPADTVRVKRTLSEYPRQLQL